jgi:two-component system OmpR family response regulator
MNQAKKQILVVDDNQDIRELIIRMLDFEDYDILTANDGEEALKIIKSHRFDLILLDVMMPGKSGIEVLSEIRSSKDSQIKNLAVVMITAKSLIDDIDAALSAGATSYIVKPFRAEAIKQKVRNIFEVRENGA